MSATRCGPRTGPPTESAGVVGVVALAYQVPQLLVPIMAAVLLPIGGDNYTALYVFAICTAVIGGLAILPIMKVR